MRLPHRAGDASLLWNRPAWDAPENIALTAPWAPHGEGVIPETYRAHLFGPNVSPELSWSAVPTGTRGLLLVCQDPDIPRDGVATHLLAALDANVDSVDAGALTTGVTTPGVVLGKGTVKRGWAGPFPPKGHGPHRYVFQLFAVAVPLDLTAGFRLRDVAAAGLPLVGRGRLTGTYER
jgi:Raf kinase inhibitor-like YbhB/YbcL family protein